MSRLRFIDIGANLVDGMYKGIYPGGSGSQKHPADLQAVLQRSVQSFAILVVRYREYRRGTFKVTRGNFKV